MFENVVYSCDDKAEISAAISPVSRNFYYYQFWNSCAA